MSTCTYVCTYIHVCTCLPAHVHRQAGLRLTGCIATATALPAGRPLQVLFRGPRCRIGIYAGLIDRVTPHPKSGRADYFGQPVNRAARLMTAGHGGQVLLERGLLQEVRAAAFVYRPCTDADETNTLVKHWSNAVRGPSCTNPGQTQCSNAGQALVKRSALVKRTAALVYRYR